jgi:NtrC-family two-component system sensor histidine kinase KinB
MTLKKEILAGYGVAFALLGLVVAWAIANLVSLGRATEAILSENYRSILAAENMVDALERQDSGILLLLLGEAGKGIGQFRENEAVFLQWLGRARDNITIPGEEALVRAIGTDYESYRRLFSSWTDSQAAAPPPIGVTAYEQTAFPLFSGVRESCVRLRNMNEETMYAASVRAGTVARRAIWSTALVSFSALVVALVFSLFLAGRIAHPIRRFMEAARKISAGDYTVQVPVETRDELGHLAREFNAMAARLDHYHEMNIEQVIAERNKSEAILESIEDALLVFDSDLRLTGANPAARRLLDLSSRGEGPVGCHEILPDPQTCEIIRATVASGTPRQIPDERRILSLPGKDRARHFLFSVTPIRRRDRTLTGVVLLLRDVTRLKEAERLKSEFVTAASHELRTPLTSLGMCVDLLLEHAGPRLEAKDRELLEAAHDEVSRMKALVSDLLDLSRLEAGRIELQIESVPVSTLVEHVEAVFRGQFDIKEVTLTSDLGNDVPRVRADANRIAWVLSNLISNALRYVSPGGHIHVAAFRAGPQVHLSVRDDGPGIPPEYQSRVFEKFVQVKGREPGGTGLGLAICKDIVKAHGGTIWVESVPGRGSTFTFTLPLA